MTGILSIRNTKRIVEPGGGNGSPGDAAPTGTTIWVADASVSSSNYANGLRYTPLRDAVSDYLAFQFVSSRTGTLSLGVRYAMSSPAANALRLRLDRLLVGTGGNPTTSPTAGTAFTVTTPGDVLVHEVGPSDSADLSFSVTAGDIVYCVFTRLGADGADTHTGDMRILEARVY